MDDPVPTKRSRRGLIVAAVLTLVAVPFLVFDNVRGDDPKDRRVVPVTIGRVPVVEVPLEARPVDGPIKGVSVVTSSTTTSTQPIILTTTTTEPLPEPVGESGTTLPARPATTTTVAE